MMDPIAELVRDLRETGKPSLAWTVRWSEDGRDPVQAAWEASTHQAEMLDMMTMLKWCGMYDRTRAQEAAARARDEVRDAIVVRLVDTTKDPLDYVFRYASRYLTEEYCHEVRVSHFAFGQPLTSDQAMAFAERELVFRISSPKACGAIRASVPPPPTLAALLEASQRATVTA